MCVVFFVYQKDPEFPLILIANRDEFYDRPTAAAENWTDFPGIFAGRDLVGGGTWLGVNETGKFAAVTNYRDPAAPKGERSRGNLVANFLKTRGSALRYLDEVANIANEYSGFNLLVGEINSTKNEIYYYSNRTAEIRKLSPGIYGLSNHLLDTPWPKVLKGKSFLKEQLGPRFSPEACFQFLRDDSLASDSELPETGIGYEREKALSSIFIRTPGYGTRCSTVVSVDKDFKFELVEETVV